MNPDDAGGAPDDQAPPIQNLLAESSPPGPSSEPSPLPAVDRIGSAVDRYTIVRLLGRGGMGAVYEARHATLARRFAIKFLLPELASNPDSLRRFENEAKAAGGLEHPNLVAVTDFGRASDGSPYLVMEFLAGEDCAALVGRLGPLPIPRAVNIVLQACRGLFVAHETGIVHRDLKPENLFLCDAGDGSDLIKVLDFGIAKLRPSEASVTTGTGTTFGTAYYMSPEQARGAGDVDQRADVWSLGVVLYELLSGRRPFEGEQFLHVIHQILSVEPPPLATLRPDLPAALGAAIARAMTKDPDQRCPTVRAWSELLAPFASRGPAWAPSPPRVSPMAQTVATPATHAGRRTDRSQGGGSVIPAGDPRSGSRRSGLTRAVAGGLVATAVVVAVVWLGNRARRDPAPPAVQPAAVQRAAPAAAPAPAPPASAASVPRDPSAAGPAVPSGRLSEQFEQRSNRRKTHVPARRKPGINAGQKSAAPVANPAPAAAPPASGRAIEIEKDNPYDR